MNFSTWYFAQYRTRSITQTPYLARTGTNTSQVATAMAQQQNNGQTDNTNINGKDKKSSEPLFGPSIGPVSSGPAWTIGSEKKVVTDELTPEIVNSWIEKSKEPSQPTTTLQALVNLKRPSLRLSPLSSAADDPSSANITDQHHHGLEFEYDCDAPKCGIYVHVHLPKSHPDAPSTSTTSLLSKLLVFETVVDGGFGNHLKLEEGALLELGRFEHPHVQPLVHDPLPSNPEPAISGDVASPTLATDAGTPTASRNNGRRRFTHFNFRKRSQNRSISGPALAVVDAEPVVAQEGKTKEGKDDVEEGVKVTIRLAALDEQGTELASPNEQITYLHIVRLGHTSTEAPKEGDELADHADARPWVVKVVKREATIGPHTFHLHEIYGLTSSSNNNTNPTITPLSTTHTYPPQEGEQIIPVLSTADNEDPQSECLLCLSSPREVVLLPCRHLVACKDCALNMVEFGAGGTITQVVDGGVGLNEGAGAVNPVTPATPGTATAPAPPPPTNQRRKRKAKGWFCPVCRQPYTSMLRITTTPPPLPENKDNEGSGTEDEGFPTAQTTDLNPSNPTTEVRGGLLAFRPGFLRGLSLSRNAPAANPDVESQAGLGRVGA